VVLIEDRDDLRLVLATALEHGGMRVACCVDGTEGLATVRSLDPELIVTDLLMPGRTGVDVARELTLPGAARPTPIVLVTAHPEAAEPVEVRNLFDAVLPKPVDPGELVAVARSLLRRAEG
jgi:DNA-binding response OmpR family regulator